MTSGTPERVVACVWDDCDQQAVYCPGHAREFVAPDHDAAIAALTAELQQCREALSGLIRDTQEWCDAVDRDSSWDGWDHHYKSLAYGGLDHYRAALKERT